MKKIVNQFIKDILSTYPQTFSLDIGLDSEYQQEIDFLFEKNWLYIHKLKYDKIKIDLADVLIDFTNY